MGSQRARTEKKEAFLFDATAGAALPLLFFRGGRGEAAAAPAEEEEVPEESLAPPPFPASRSPS